MKLNYSELIISRSADISTRDIIRKIKQGTKIILLTDVKVDIILNNEIDSNLIDLINQSMLFQQYNDSRFHFPKLPIIIINGKGLKRYLSEIEKYFLNFNRDQYLIEHHDNPQKSIVITAGAGTGKTTVMIQRIIYLFEYEEINPEEITMITFTTEAAKNMYEKLNEALLLRFQITNNPKYVILSEQIGLMTISTIDSFLKKIVKKISGELGISPNFNIKNFGREKKEIIEFALDDYINKNQHTPEIQRLLKKFRDYEIINNIKFFWEEFDKKGIPIDNLNEFKKTFNKNIEDPIHLLICEVIYRSNELFNEQQINENALTLGSMSKLLNNILEVDSAFSDLDFNLNYLFIDEFQDSSDFQIKLTQKLIKEFNIKTFIVGDVKQAIYRFRGADDNAFEKFKAGFNEKDFSDFSLKINYRTTKELLEKIENEILGEWGKFNDRNLVSYKETKSDLKSLIITNVDSENKELIKFQILDWIQNLSKNQITEENIAVLTRTRKEAKQIATWFEQEGIGYFLDIGGTLFESEAARDLNRLLHSLLFLNSSQHICDYLQSPYSEYILDPYYLIKFNGDEKSIVQALEPYLTNLRNYQRDIRLKPVLSLLRNIIDQSEVFKRFYEMKLKSNIEEAEAVRQTFLYKNNLNKLLDLIVEQVNSDYISLPSLLNWLKVQIKTNRNEDEAKVTEISNNIITIQTVHRSKGLEYGAVLIPYTDRYFFSALRRTNIIFSENKNEVSLRIMKNKYYFTSSKDHDDYTKKEQDAVIAEELRLLYVAMTRAKNHLWILKSIKKPITWSAYLPSIIRN